MKKYLLLFVLVFAFVEVNAQEVTESSYARKKTADEKKQAYKNHERLKKNFFLYNFISRFKKQPAGAIIRTTPVFSHNPLFIDINHSQVFFYANPFENGLHKMMIIPFNR